MAERQSRSQLQVPGFDKPLDLLQSHRAHYEASQHRVLEFTLTKDDAEVATATALIIHKDNLRGRSVAACDLLIRSDVQQMVRGTRHPYGPCLPL